MNKGTDEHQVDLKASDPDKRAQRRFARIEAQGRLRTHRTAIAAIVALLAISVITIVAWFVWPQNSGRAGRPVSAPRNLGTEQPFENGQAATEYSITLEPEFAARAGIKIEPVGEALLTRSMPSQAATGVVQPNAYRTTPVISLVSGIVRSVRAELGENVRRGQTMAVVFSDELAKTQSRYLTALAEHEEHHKHHQRTTKLIEIGAASREELEQATTKLKMAETELAAQRQRLLLLGLDARRIESLETSSQVDSHVELPAPVSGTIIGRTANPGEVISANQELLRIADLSSVWVVGQIYEKDLGGVVVGSGASITSEAYPGQVFRGRVSYIDPTLDPATRTAQARIELANPRQAFKIGMFVNVAFAGLGLSEATAPVIPKNAVQNVGNQQVVFIETKDPDVFAMRPVKVGPEVNGQYPVLEGLTLGERIVTEGSFLLRAEWLKRNPG